MTRIGRVHQNTASSLFFLSAEGLLRVSMGEVWEKNRIVCHWKSDVPTIPKLYPQFKFWLLILWMQLAAMVYVRSVREADLLLYVDALTKIVHWFFALDQTHYPDASLFIYGTWLHHCVCRVRERKFYCEEVSAQILCHIATDQLCQGMSRPMLV